MTVSELREILNGLDGSLPLLLATQPNWPMQHDVSTAIATDGALYIREQGQIGYLPDVVAGELGGEVSPRPVPTCHGCREQG